METKIKVTFKSANVEKSLEVSDEISVKELIEKFVAEYNISTDKINKEITFLFDGRNFYTSGNFNKKLKSTNLKKGIPIVVMDRNNLLNPELIKKENEIIYKQNRRRQDGKKTETTSVEELKMLEEISILGYIEKGKTEAEYKIFPEKFITTDQAILMKENDEQLFILGLLGKYLEKLNVKVLIEKDIPNSNQQMSNNNILQFLINGMMIETKNYLIFDADSKKIDILNKNENERQNFIMYIKATLSKIYNIPNNQLIVTYFPQQGTFKLIVTFKQNPNINLDLNYLQKELHSDNDLSGLKLDVIKKSSIIDQIKLNKLMLDYHGDCLDKSKWPIKTEKRGGEYYYPPKDWIRYGLKVWKQYDNENNDWLSWENDVDGEWCVAYYCAIDSEENKKINDKYENDQDKKHPGKKVGRGTFITKYPKKLQEYAIKVGNYQIGFMVRVKPDAIRIPTSDDSYWVVNGTPDEIRPYGILIREI